MSQRTLIIATRDRIRSVLELGDDPLRCEAMFDGQPNPMAGEQFVAVHPGDWTGQSGDNDLEEMIGVNVTVTRRLGAYPMDRYGPEVWAKTQSGLDVILRRIVVAVHRSYVILNAANAALYAESTTQFGFAEPLSFLNGGRPMAKGPDWFNAEPDQQPGRWANAGVAQQLTFGRAKRVQVTTIME